MKTLDRLVGDWTIEAQGPALGDTTVTARVSFTWALAGTAMLQRGEVDHPQAFAVADQRSDRVKRGAAVAEHFGRGPEC